MLRTRRRSERAVGEARGTQPVLKQCCVAMNLGNGGLSTWLVGSVSTYNVYEVGDCYDKYKKAAHINCAKSKPMCNKRNRKAIP